MNPFNEGDIVMPMKEIPEGVDREAIVRAISAAVKPRRIILFGSKARGDSKPDSDTDICVIVDRLERKWIDTSIAIRDELYKESIGAIDLVLFEENSFNERSVFRSTFEHVISDEGVLLYDGS